MAKHQRVMFGLPAAPLPALDSVFSERTQEVLPQSSGAALSAPPQRLSWARCDVPYRRFK